MHSLKSELFIPAPDPQFSFDFEGNFPFKINSDRTIIETLWCVYYVINGKAPVDSPQDIIKLLKYLLIKYSRATIPYPELCIADIRSFEADLLKEESKQIRTLVYNSKNKSKTLKEAILALKTRKNDILNYGGISERIFDAYANNLTNKKIKSFIYDINKFNLGQISKKKQKPKMEIPELKEVNNYFYPELADIDKSINKLSKKDLLIKLKELINKIHPASGKRQIKSINNNNNNNNNINNQKQSNYPVLKQQELKDINKMDAVKQKQFMLVLKEVVNNKFISLLALSTKKWKEICKLTQVDIKINPIPVLKAFATNNWDKKTSEQQPPAKKARIDLVLATNTTQSNNTSNIPAFNPP